MDVFIQIMQFVLAISILVVLHECGHYFPAKFFKTKIEKFYLFFDPWFSIAKKKIGETEYGIGWLPLGGYVKIAGMIDESMDSEQLAKPAQPWEFRSKPAWQRLIIMLGGVIVNFFLAWIIYACLSFFNGESFIDTKKFDDGLAFSPAAQKIGFQNNDKIVAIDGKPSQDFTKLSIDILLSDQITVERQGKTHTFATNQDGLAAVFAQEDKGFVTPRTKAVVDSVVSPSAKAAGLQAGDLFVGINGQSITFQDELAAVAKTAAGKTTPVKVLRQGQEVALNLPISKEGKIGFSNAKTMVAIVEKAQNKTQFSFLQAIPRGFTRSIEVLGTQVRQFKLVFNKKVKGYTKVSGPIGIVKNMPTSFDWAYFWGFTAMFSVWLAFLNLLPIPGLDGGHVVFTLYEMLRGKPAPQKVIENAQMVGMMLLMGLMVVTFGADLFK
jgi:regulator of sigma E protease